MGLRQRQFELEHARGALLGLVEAGQFQHGRDVLLVLGAQLGHARIVLEVVGAVGHAQAALQQVRQVARRVGQALADPDAEQILGEEVGGVERVDVGAHRGAQRPHQGRLVLDRGDLRQHRLDRRQAALLDRRLVHVGGVEIGHLARFAARLPGRAQLLDHLRDAGVGVLGQRTHRAPGAAVGRDLGLRQPVAVGVGEEVVARQHGHAGGLVGGLAGLFFGWSFGLLVGLRRRLRASLAGGERRRGQGAAQGEGDTGLDQGRTCLHGFLVIVSGDCCGASAARTWGRRRAFCAARTRMPSPTRRASTCASWPKFLAT